MNVAMFSSAAAWFAVVLAAGVGPATADDLACAGTSDIARLEVLTTVAVDDDATSLGWVLICDDRTTVWEAPIGSIQDIDTWYFESSCIDLGSTCNFRISSSSNTFYTLTYGATTIARSTKDKNSTQTEEIFCFGAQCFMAPPERIGDSSPGAVTHGENDMMWKYFLTRKSFVIWLVCLVLSMTIAVGVLCARCGSSEHEDASDEKTLESYDSGVIDPTFVS